MNSLIDRKITGKKKFVRRMFDDISERYDLLNRVISFGLDGVLRKKTVSIHGDDSFVLDICSGTGDMAVELLNMNGFDGVIVMGDFSGEMHKAARKKLNGNSNVFHVFCDAENMPFKDSSFNGIINGYSLRNLGDLKAFGTEIYRTLKSGGQSSMVDVAHPPNRMFAWFFYLYFYKLIPLLSRLFTKKKYAYRYLPVSLRTFLKQDEVLKALKESELSGEYENVLFGAAAIYRLRKY